MSNEGNIKDSMLLILLKSIVAGSNGNERPEVSCFQITSRWICYSIFFDISLMFFTRLSSKSLWRNYPFSAQISKVHFKLQHITEKLRCLTFWYWNGGSLNRRWKVVRFWGFFFKNKKCWHFEFSWIKYFRNYFS